MGQSAAVLRRHGIAELFYQFSQGVGLGGERTCGVAPQVDEAQGTGGHPLAMCSSIARRSSRLKEVAHSTVKRDSRERSDPRNRQKSAQSPAYRGFE